MPELIHDARHQTTVFIPQCTKMKANILTLLLAIVLPLGSNAQVENKKIISQSDLSGSYGSTQTFLFQLVGNGHTIELSGEITRPGNVDLILTEEGDTDYSKIPENYVGQKGQYVFPNVSAGRYKIVVFGKTNYSGFSFSLEEIIKPVNVVLFLHGFQGTPDSWHKFLKYVSKKTQQEINAPVIFGGVIQGGPATATTGTSTLADGEKENRNYFFYRISFGAYDTTSGRKNLLGHAATEPESGDFETFKTLGFEVDQAVSAILAIQPSAQIVLVAHSRGGLAARAFLQGAYTQEKASVVGLVTLGTPHAGSYFGRLGLYLSTHPKSVDHETWRLARILRHSDQVDAYRPTVSDLATGGIAITTLNEGVKNLPTSNMSYCNYVYIGRAFGDFPFALGNIFHGSDSIPGHVSDAAKQAMIGNIPYGRIGGDGVVDPNSQRMDMLPGLPSGIKITTLTNPNGLFHTFEHNQKRDILNALETVKGWQILP